jgi:hypothetical protein
MAQTDPNLAAQQATYSATLASDQVVLLGLFAGADGPAALLRGTTGQIIRVVLGQQVMGVMVTAIGDERVLLTGADGVTQIVMMP